MVRAKAHDQIAWPYFNISAIGKVMLGHSLGNVSWVKVKAKWSPEGDSAGPLHFSCEPVTKERTLTCSWSEQPESWNSW